MRAAGFRPAVKAEPVRRGEHELRCELIPFEIEGGKFFACETGFAVIGDRHQIIIVDEIQLVKDVAWLHEDGSVDFLKGPDEKFRAKLVRILNRMFRHPCPR